MKPLLLALLAIAFSFSSPSNAGDIFVVCEGCNDTDYRALATEVAGEQGTYSNYVQAALNLGTAKLASFSPIIE